MTDAPDISDAAAPDAMRAALAARADELTTAGHSHHTGAVADVREAEYRGHRIEVRTTYAITVDGRPFDVHVVVDNEGRVFYHGLPTRDFPSVITLVEKAIDTFPDDFRPGTEPDAGGHDHMHAHGHQHSDTEVGHEESAGEVD